MQSNKLLALCCATAISAFSTNVLAADVVIGVPNWPSVQATAHVLKVALESKLGLEVELKDGSNQAVFDAMDAGTMHVHPEAWLPNLNHLRRKYVISKKSVKNASQRCHRRTRNVCYQRHRRENRYQGAQRVEKSRDGQEVRHRW